jgi:hypothetical protein
VDKPGSYNNRIVGNTIRYSYHNNIDLHIGSYNTLVENNVIEYQTANGQGIYFHNIGSGLVVRNNNIRGMMRSIYCEPYPASKGGFTKDVLVEYNTIYDGGRRTDGSRNGYDSGCRTTDGVLENVTFRYNTWIKPVMKFCHWLKLKMQLS